MANVRRDMRRHPRRATEVAVVLSDASRRIRGAIRLGSADVSKGGAFVRSDLLFEVGEMLDVEVELPNARRIRTRGKVVRVSRGSTRGSPSGMGIEFIDLTPADRAAIEEGLEHGRNAG